MCACFDGILLLIITDSTSLKSLGFSNNPIGDDGILLISSQLKQNTILTELSVAECRLSVKGKPMCCM